MYSTMPKLLFSWTIGSQNYGARSGENLYFEKRNERLRYFKPFMHHLQPHVTLIDYVRFGIQETGGA